MIASWRKDGTGMGSSIEYRSFGSRLEVDEGSGHKCLESLSWDLMVQVQGMVRGILRFGMSAGGLPKASCHSAQVWAESALKTPLHMRRLAALSRRTINLAIDSNQAGLQTFENKKIRAGHQRER